MPKKKGKEPRSNHASGQSVGQTALTVPVYWDFAEEPTIDPTALHTGYSTYNTEAYNMQGTDPGASALGFNYDSSSGIAASYDPAAALDIASPDYNHIALQDLQGDAAQAAGFFGDDGLGIYNPSEYYDQQLTMHHSHAAEA